MQGNSKLKISLDILRLIKRYTILDAIFIYLRSMVKRLKLKKLDLSGISKYFNDNNSNVKSNRNVLVEFLSDYPNMVHNVSNRNLYLQNVMPANSIALIHTNLDLKMKYLANVYGINRFASIYTYKNVAYKLKSLLFLINNIKKLKYEKTYGWSIVCEGVEVGDLIYDQFLRFTNLPTYRKLDLRFVLYIYNAMFLFYRYKNILIENNITDVILSHDVYADMGLFFRVAYIVDPDIKFYNGETLNHGLLVIQSATKGHIIKPQVPHSRTMQDALPNYSQQELMKEFMELVDIRFSGKKNNDFDNANVYTNTEINSINELIDGYAVHKKAKNFFIYSHAFVDAVKYFETLYSDYYTWLYETLKILAEISLEHNFYVKPHPSESHYKCDVTVKNVVDEINDEFGAKFIYLEEKLNNYVVFEHADACITCSGTIAIEAVCFGVPVLTTSNRFSDLNTTINSNSIEEYRERLESIIDLPKPTQETVSKARLFFIFFEKYSLCDLGYSIENKYFCSYEQFEFINSKMKELPKLKEQELFNAFKYAIDNNHTYTFRK